METYSKNRPVNWGSLIKQLEHELTALCPEERAWLKSRAFHIGEIQQDLDKLFQQAGGLLACADCDGECCGCGRHHLTLINLIAFLIEGDVPPVPDFARTCPFMGEAGCLLPVARRPYNCITFFCEILEERLDQEGREELKMLDQKLREEYEKVERRYVAGTLRGIWIGLDRVAGQAVLKRKG